MEDKKSHLLKTRHRIWKEGSRGGTKCLKQQATCWVDGPGTRSCPSGDDMIVSAKNVSTIVVGGWDIRAFIPERLGNLEDDGFTPLMV